MFGKRGIKGAATLRAGWRKTVEIIPWKMKDL